MTDTPTAEEIAQHYTAMGHSVDLLNAGQPEDMEDADWTDTVSAQSASSMSSGCPAFSKSTE